MANAYTGIPSMYQPAAADHDQRRSVEQEARDRERQAKQWDAVRDYVSSHPGVSHRSAFMILSHDRPDLFRDPETGQTPEEREELHHSNQLKQQRILKEIDRIRKAQPQSFERAWNRVREQRPEWFQFDESP